MLWLRIFIACILISFIHESLATFRIRLSYKKICTVIINILCIHINVNLSIHLQAFIATLVGQIYTMFFFWTIYKIGSVNYNYIYIQYTYKLI